MISNTQDQYILDQWEKKAQLHGAKIEASWGDANAIQLEIEAISDYLRSLPAGNRVLDVGCGNGHSTYAQYVRHYQLRYFGIDASNTLIQHCHERHSDWWNTFEVADMRRLPHDTDMFDLTYCTRALINLPNWEEQQRAIDEMFRVTNANGTVLISEAFWEPLQNLNALRTIAGLPPLVVHDFNKYLHLDKVTDYITHVLGYNVEKVNFTDAYYIGTRFIRDLLVSLERYPGYTDPLNNIFAGITRPYASIYKDFGIQQLLVCKQVPSL